MMQYRSKGRLTVLENGQPAVKRTIVLKLYTRHSCCNRSFIGARHAGTRASSRNIE